MATTARGRRERKKAQTGARVQQAALDGFEEHGFAETSIEQVSDLVDVSTTMFFRYFRFKDEAVFHDGFSLVFLDALRAQPDPLDPLDAIRSVPPIGRGAGRGRDREHGRGR